MVEKARRQPIATRLRNYFLTGVIICAPIAITAYLTWTVVLWVDGWVKPYIPRAYNPDSYLPFSVPGFGLLTALVLITLIGFLTANFVGKTILSIGESLLARMPLVRSVYKGLKQIFQTVLAEQSNSFKQAALIEFPRKGTWVVVFVATDARGEIEHRIDAGDLVSVFMPTTPNPTSGFLIFVPRTDVIFLDMSIEEAAKMVISAGLVTPEFTERQIEKATEKKTADEVT